MLRDLGYQPKEKVSPSHPWTWTISTGPDNARLNVGVSAHPKRPLVQVDFALNFREEDMVEFKRRVGPRGVGEAMAKIQLLLLNDNLDFSFKAKGETLQKASVFDYITPDAVTHAALELSIRRVKGAFFKIMTTLQLAAAMSEPDEAAPKLLDATPADITSGVQLVTTASALPEVSPETLEGLHKAGVPGQTLDETLGHLLHVFRLLSAKGQTVEDLVGKLERQQKGG